MVLFYYKSIMSNIRQDITIINERLKKIYILYRKLRDSQRSEGINGVKVNGSNVPVVDKEVNITVPTKTSELTNDSDYTTNSKLNKEIQDRISADNLKLDKPTIVGDTNSYPNIVGINGEGDTSFLSANSFGKVDTVMGVSPDANKNVDISSVAMNWTNANHRWSALPNKSTDDTYNKVMVLDAYGKAGVKEPVKALFFNKDGIVTGKMATFIDVFETDKDGVFTADFSMVGFKEPPKVIVSTETVEPASVTKAENGTYVSIFKDSITTTGCTGRVKLATSAGLLVGMVSVNAGAGVKVTVEAKGLI